MVVWLYWFWTCGKCRGQDRSTPKPDLLRAQHTTNPSVDYSMNEVRAPKNQSLPPNSLNPDCTIFTFMYLQELFNDNLLSEIHKQKSRWNKFWGFWFSILPGSLTHATTAAWLVSVVRVHASSSACRELVRVSDCCHSCFHLWFAANLAPL